VLSAFELFWTELNCPFQNGPEVTQSEAEAAWDALPVCTKEKYARLSQTLRDEALEEFAQRQIDFDKIMVLFRKHMSEYRQAELKG
jgi:hypothetical protein